jgi:zeta-carotene desaturase
VFYESFLRSPQGGRLGIPAKPLSEFFGPVVDLARRLGVDLRTKAAVDGIVPAADGRWRVRAGEQEIEAASVVLALDFQATRKLLASAGSPPISQQAETLVGPALRNAPITTVHLWYDREVVDLDHAVLLDTRIQWVFAKSRIRGWEGSHGSYLELVISASWAEIAMGREEILASALAELERFFPRVREARLLKSAVLKEARATFSVVPGLDRYRPRQTTACPGLLVAGDWTATEWPSTMEGAVRSGRLAAGEAVGERGRFLAPELPATGLMGWLGDR